MALNRTYGHYLNILLTLVCHFTLLSKIEASPLACSEIFQIAKEKPLISWDEYNSDLAQNHTSNLFPVKAIKIKRLMHLDNYEFLDYSAFNSILFLSDAGRGGRRMTPLRSANKFFVSTDFNIKKYGTDVQVDNNRLPFRDNSFDLIIMNRGLCPCHSAVACGGIDTQRKPMKDFLESSLNLLDKENPNSLAVFTGYYFPELFRKTVPELWTSIVAELQIKYPHVQIALLLKDIEGVEDTHSNFIGIVISTDTVNPIHDKLRLLNPNLL